MSCDCVFPQVLECACMAGRIVLENGGEIYRVEQTIWYICKAYGTHSCESYATPTSMIVSITDADGQTYTKMLRIVSRNIDLNKVAEINALSRALSKQPLPIEDTLCRLKQIDCTTGYPTPVTVLASGIAAASFAVVFGGGAAESIGGFFLGMVLRSCICALQRRKSLDFINNFLGGAIAACGSCLMQHLGLISDWWTVALSAIMLLVPGMLFTNAFRDVAAGDYISGISRLMEAGCVAAALACGASTTYAVLAHLGGVAL